ncbi:uncharacterized protein A4U43_C09F580 [Asparagus officinalis]|uniref:Uncharacterized protein n=1 Tax=Asparagus officinalis TaxID=4686 RepID=A0A5P1E484_ASPOF|nr:uncharacterized protein A4U43_C09F580 [Asparagus officinalis]
MMIGGSDPDPLWLVVGRDWVWSPRIRDSGRATSPIFQPPRPPPAARGYARGYYEVGWSDEGGIRGCGSDSPPPRPRLTFGPEHGNEATAFAFETDKLLSAASEISLGCDNVSVNGCNEVRRD